MKRKRKDAIFSVSTTKQEKKEIDTFLADIRAETGFVISRNQFMRKAALTLVRYLKSAQKGEQPDIQDMFKSID